MKLINKWLVITLAVCALLTQGCQTPGKVLASTAVTVDASMRAWSSYVNSGNATDDQQNKVRVAYSKYQASMKVAKDAFITANETGNKDPYVLATTVLENNAAAIVNLIQMFQMTTP
jgi:hypothetical protein